MTDENKRKFKSYTFAMDMFNRKISEDSIVQMLTYFEDVSADHFERAIRMLVKDGDYMPTIADIRDTLKSYITIGSNPNPNAEWIDPDLPTAQEIGEEGLF